ncbi:MAG: hypothetical protein KBA46_04185 [Candidatus Omnitrophica bacterium]|nr:hypothetical protein [Candidatus Omnitrophota bacterium]
MKSVLKKLSLLRNPAQFNEKLEKKFVNLCTLVIDKVENAKYKRLSPYYKYLYSKEVIRDNTRPINEELLKKTLLRIANSYIAATAKHEKISHPAYKSSAQWKAIIDQFYAPLKNSLISKDLQAMTNIFGNFCRTTVSRGLEFGMNFTQFGKNGFDASYANSYLRRLHFWVAFLSEKESLKPLAFPLIGNPFGIVVDGDVIPHCTIRHHYYAMRILQIEKANPRPIVCEIGGGFGGMAYHFLKNSGKGSKFIDFDLPEVLALCSYFLLLARPNGNKT